MASNMDITFLGTGGSWPSPGRSLPSVAVRVDDVLNLFDCGEGTQKQIMKSDLSFMKIQNVFITHFHGDHFLGLLGLIQSMSFNGREEPLHIYGPPGSIQVMENALSVGYYTLGYRVIIHSLEPGASVDLGKFIIRTHPNDHPVPCIAYSLEEKDLVRIDPEKARSLNIPSRKLEVLRNNGIIEHNGRTVSLDEVSSGIRKGRKIVYTGDTRPMEDMKLFAKDADVLIHDTTTDSSLEPTVNQYGHTSSRQAAIIARDANVKRFYLFHYSPRVENPSSLLEEAKSIFPESYLSRELLHFDVKVRR